jgi:hypothetical protein
MIPVGVIIAFGYKYASMSNAGIQPFVFSCNGSGSLYPPTHPPEIITHLSILADRMDRFDVYAPK